MVLNTPCRIALVADTITFNGTAGRPLLLRGKREDIPLHGCTFSNVHAVGAVTMPSLGVSANVNVTVSQKSDRSVPTLGLH